jgi:recombination protein RecR
VLSPAVEDLVSQLARLPGVGRRTAQRLAFHLLRVPSEEALALAHAIEEVKARIGFCVDCFNLAEGERCVICLDARRDRSMICVVEAPADIIPLERTAEFRGLYHVLGGALSPIDGVDRARDEPHDDRRGDRLVRRRPPARYGESDPPREWASRRWRPRVCGRGHTRASPLWTPGALAA